MSAGSTRPTLPGVFVSRAGNLVPPIQSIVTHWAASFCVLLLVSGCINPPRRAIVVTDPDPTIKIPAMKSATRSANHSVVPQLVRDLESDDSAVRLFAIQSLRDLTSQTLGYRYYDDELRRQEAVRRWEKWLKTHKSKLPDTRPATGPTSAATRAR